MNHQLDKASAECETCEQSRLRWLDFVRAKGQPNRDVDVKRSHQRAAEMHLQAQQALLWDAAVEAFGDNPIAEFLSIDTDPISDVFTTHGHAITVAIRNRM